MARPFYTINQHIKADKVRVVDEAGVQIGVLDTSEALNQARSKDLDLVIVAPQAKPPVAKMVSFSKFKYEQKQKRKTGQKKAKGIDIKEIRLTPFIAEGDYNTRIKRAREFLEDGNKVRLNVKFVGRQITRKQFGQDLMARVIEDLADMATVEREPAFQGKVLSAQVQPKKG